MQTLSNKFAHLPNGIIHSIIEYSGIVIKISNGKRMFQIPKTDPRYELLRTIPEKRIIFYYDPVIENQQFSTYVTLHINDRKLVLIDVSGMYFNGEEHINYNWYFVNYDNIKSRRNYHYREGYTNNKIN